ncbi:glycosyltransferase [Vibrio sp. MMG022]|uniref:glycosyltransferase n=1 Tax=Vibrio sp. MMG023 TaxID=2909979 RepID=UPI001F2F9680|nr:glycosyltransferase [Vibrio sp. MMG023]MCF6453904.1 glycosyltransferase [Vibrio sp. MMG023]
MKLLFIVSNLRRTGPTNQLFYIIKNLSEEFQATVLTLSPEPQDSELKKFLDANISVDSLSLSRLKGFVKGKSLLKSYIDNFKPDIIQTQGIRADGLLASLSTNAPWITTSRNFPKEDYPTKFGFAKGKFMAIKHEHYLSSCPNLISCSHYIHDCLSSVNIESKVIQNGTLPSTNQSTKAVDKEHLNIISVGSLIPRKNMTEVLAISSSLTDLGVSHSLKILGDGPQMEELKLAANDNVEFLGNINNVREHLSQADVFISTSLSEGLPNTVLEALAEGVNLILSEIPSHEEIVEKLDHSHYFIIPKERALEEYIQDVVTSLDSMSFDVPHVKNFLEMEFSDRKMSINYQDLYRELVYGK